MAVADVACRFGRDLRVFHHAEVQTDSRGDQGTKRGNENETGQREEDVTAEVVLGSRYAISK